MSNLEKPSKFHWFIAVIFIGAAIAFVAFFNNNGGEEMQSERTSQAPNHDMTTDGDALTEEGILTKTDQFLDILYTLYFISLDESGEPETEYELLLSMMEETLNDKRKLESLRIPVAQFSSSKSELVTNIGQAIDFSLASLVDNHASFSDYLRTVDSQDIDLTEFGYQMTSFSSNNKGAFDTLNQASLLLPYIWLDLAKEEDAISEWAISEESRMALILKIEDMFGDILKEDAINHEMTGNTNSVAFIISTYLDFLKEPQS